MVVRRQAWMDGSGREGYGKHSKKMINKETSEIAHYKRELRT